MATLPTWELHNYPNDRIQPHQNASGHGVYCAWDSTIPLYVGKSENIRRRMWQHRNRASAWIDEWTELWIWNAYDLLYHIEDTTDVVAFFEEHLIRLLNPKYNIVHNTFSPYWS